MNFKDYIQPGRGASDIFPLLLDGEAFHELVERLAALFEGVKIDKIACIEARGFILGSALAYKLQIGIIPLRKEGSSKNEVFTARFTDYTGKEKILEMSKSAVNPKDKILIIDDWVETGGALKAAIELIEGAQGEIVGIGAFMDDSTDETKELLGKYNYKFIEKVLPEDTF